MIMADPLTNAAESLAPSRASTNFFDPRATENIVSRYANTRIAGAAAQESGDAASRLAESRLRRLELSRANTKWDEDRQEHADREDWKAKKGEFLLEFGTKLDPEADDYEDRRVEMFSKLPDVARNDPAVHAIVAAKDARRERLMQARDREALKEEARQAHQAELHEKIAMEAAEAGVSPDEIQAFVRPDKSIDLLSLGYEVGKRKAAEKKRLEQVALDKLAAQDELRTRREDAKTETKDFSNLIHGNADAFVPQVNVLLDRAKREKPDKYGQGLGDEVAQLKIDYPQAYKDAVEWDKDRYGSELQSAKRESDKDKWVELVPSAKSDPKIRDLRARFWEHAHKKEAEPAAPATTAEPSKEDAPPEVTAWVNVKDRDGNFRTVPAAIGGKKLSPSDISREVGENPDAFPRADKAGRFIVGKEYPGANGGKAIFAGVGADGKERWLSADSR